MAIVGLGSGAVVAVSSPWVEREGDRDGVAGLPGGGARGMRGALLGLGRRVEAAVAAVAITGGVLWSNALAYHEVSLAPRGQLHELETIGRDFAGQGPALMTSYEPYGARHFLRRSDPEGASELRRRFVSLRDGSELDKGESADIDRFRLDGILDYRTLVLRRGPAASRPPSVYRLVRSGRYYEVWQRPESGRADDRRAPVAGERDAGCRGAPLRGRAAARPRGWGGRAIWRPRRDLERSRSSRRR